MDICHWFEYEKDAEHEFRNFYREHMHEIVVNPSYKPNAKYCRLVNGEVHWFMGAQRYYDWCMGRDYILDGVHYRSGYTCQSILGFDMRKE